MSYAAAVGLGLILVGGLLQGSFTLPLKRMPGWRWENSWLVYSVAAMLALPWLLAVATVPHSIEILGVASRESLAKIALFGFGWGIGSVFFGLGITAVGMGLGFAIILGLTASIGSLLPLVVLDRGRLFTRQGHVLIGGLTLVIVGIMLCAVAGSRREKERAVAVTQSSTTSRFYLGLLICALSGVFSPMLNFSFVFGSNLQQLTIESGSRPAMASSLVWAVALSSGFLANAGYCVYLLNRNRTWALLGKGGTRAFNWMGSVLMGVLWLAGIVVYGMGAADLGPLGGVIGWPVFMATIIIAANLWGALTGEWQGIRRSTCAYSGSGIGFLLAAIYVISLGNSS